MQPGDPADPARPSPGLSRPVTGATPPPPYEPPPPYRSYRPSPAALTLLVAAVLGAFCSLSTTNRTSANGVQTSCSYFDFGPLIFGGIAAVASLVVLATATRPPRQPVVEISIGVLGLAVAAVHVLRAFGMIGGPC